MSNGADKKVSKKLTLLAALDRAGAPVDTSKIAEVQDWSGAIVGGFYGASVTKPSKASRLLSHLTRGFRHPVTRLNLDAPVAGKRAESFQPGGILPIPARIEQEAGTAISGSGTTNHARLVTPQLVAECLNATEGSWTEFVHRTQPMIYRTVFKAAQTFGSLSRDAIDDLVQDVYLRLCTNDFRALREFNSLKENALSGFLKVIASNVVHDHFRQLSAKRGGGSHPALPSDFMAGSVPGRSSTEQGHLFSAIDKALQTLSQKPHFERDRKIFWLYYSQGLTAREISTQPGIGLGQKGVESVLLRQTKLIRAAFQNSPVVDLTKLREKRS